MLRLKIKIGKLFKVAPKFTVHLIRLMAVANDLNTVVACLTQLSDNPRDHAEQSQIVGRRVYFFRLAYGHFHEAVQVLKELGKDCPDIFYLVPPDALAKYNKVATTIEPMEKRLARMRHHAIFHYDFSEYEGVLHQWGESAEEDIIIGEIRRDTSYGVADEVLTKAMLRAFDLQPLETEEDKTSVVDLLDRLLPLLVDLLDFVNGLLYAGRQAYPEFIEPIRQ